MSETKLALILTAMIALGLMFVGNKMCSRQEHEDMRAEIIILKKDIIRLMDHKHIYSDGRVVLK